MLVTNSVKLALIKILKKIMNSCWSKNNTSYHSCQI